MSWLEQRLAEQGQTIEQVFQLASQSQAAAPGLDRQQHREPAVPRRDGLARLRRGDERGRARPCARIPPGCTRRWISRRAIAIATSSRRSPSAAPCPRTRWPSGGRSAAIAGSRALTTSPAERSATSATSSSTRAARLGARAPAIRRSPRTRLRRLGASFPLSRLPRRAARPDHGRGHEPCRALDAREIGAARRGLARVGGRCSRSCASQLAIALVHWAATLLVRPRILPRLDFSTGIPAAHRTVVAVPTMLTDAVEIDELLEALEVRFLANRDPNLAFALVSDFRDAPPRARRTTTPCFWRTRDGDRGAERQVRRRRSRRRLLPVPSRAPLEPTRRRVDGLGAQARQARGRSTRRSAASRRFRRRSSVPSIGLRDVKYVIALDSDTELPRDSARQLVGTLAHPLNRPVYDERLGRVTEGYAILQPRVGITMASTRRSRFARLFAGDPGSIPTRARSPTSTRTSSARARSSARASTTSMRFGARSAAGSPRTASSATTCSRARTARSGLVSDVMLFEDYPSTYAADVSRRARWIRGDWQITPWLLSARAGRASERRVQNPISRSRAGRSSTTCAGAWFRGAAGAARSSAGACRAWRRGLDRCGRLGPLLPGLLAAASRAGAPPRRASASIDTCGEIARDLGRQLLREAFALACLPYEAFIASTRSRAPPRVFSSAASAARVADRARRAAERSAPASRAPTRRCGSCRRGGGRRDRCLRCDIRARCPWPRPCSRCGRWRPRSRGG